MSSSQRVSWIAVMTALCVSTNYMLVGVVNVKFMDLIVFVSGLMFGAAIGGSVGVLTWLVYGTINPYGFSLPILVATSLGESLYGIVGGILRDSGSRSSFQGSGVPGFISLRFAVVGFLLTFVYDLFTNIVSGVTAGIPIATALLVGIPFALIHEISNAALFFVGVVPLMGAIRHLPLGGLESA